MKILIVLPSLKRAGAEIQAVNLANGFARARHEVHVCCFERALDQRDRLLDNVKFHFVERSHKYDTSVSTRMAKIIDQEGIDIVQTVLNIATLYGWLASVVSRRRPPVVAALHTTLPRDRKARLLFRFPYRQIYGRMAALIFVCSTQKDHWIGRFPEWGPLARVVHNGVDTADFCRVKQRSDLQAIRAGLGIPPAAFVFTCIAAFRPEKAHALLLHAFARVKGDAYLLLAGDGPCRNRITELADELRLTRRLRFVGNVEDVRPLIAATDATVLASTAVETFSMAMLESMSLGVPMIAPRIGGLPEAIDNGVNGLLSQVGDIEDLARCMQLLLNDRQMAVRMGIAAAQTVRANFSVDQMVSKNLRVLELVSARRRLGGSFEQDQT